MEFVGTGEFGRGLPVVPAGLSFLESLVRGQVQPSLFDKLRAGSAGLISAGHFSSDSAQASLASLAWTTQGWLCLFLGRPTSLLTRQLRELLKIKALLSDSSSEKRRLSPLFHGKFFRSSWATANLTGAKRVPRGNQFPGRRDIPACLLSKTSLHSSWIALRSNSKERPNEEPSDDAGNAGACLGNVRRTGTDNRVWYN
jgi:hypothetical protein